MSYQLRDYRITPGAMNDFVTEWRAQVVPLREKAGFQIINAWSNRETNRFVWILAYDGDFEEADRKYNSSVQRAEISPDPARFIEEAHSEFVSPAL